MRVGYIKQEKIPLKIIDRIKYFLGMVVVREYEQGIVFQIPILEKEQKMDKVLQNLQRQIQKVKVDTIVFSEDCIHSAIYFKMEAFLNNMGTNIVTGRKLMHYMNYEILQYILRIQETNMKQEDVFFLIKKDDSLDLQFLSRFVENCKTVNIVTNDIERFKKVQDNLYHKENILISVSNNKSKSLKRARYVLNVNMGQKELEKFKINRDAIIINFKESILYRNPTFNGININYFQICMPDEYIEQLEPVNELEEFDTTRLYEAILFKKVENVKKKIIMLSKEELDKHKNLVTDMIADDNIYVTGLIGNNGRINESEFIQNYQKVIRK